MITLNNIIKACHKLDEQNVPKAGRYIRMTEDNLKQLSDEYCTHNGDHSLLENRIMGCHVFITNKNEAEGRLIDIFKEGKL